MFALLTPPYPPIDPSTIQTLSATQYAYILPSSLSFSHLVVFLVPGHTLPPDTGAGIYIRFPSPAGQPEGEFKLLGGLGEGKVSAVFKVNRGDAGRGGGGEGKVVGEVNGVQEVDMDAEEDEAAGGGGDAAGGALLEGDIVVGISVEPVATLGPQLAALAAQRTAANGGGLDAVGGAYTAGGNNGAGAMTVYNGASSGAARSVPTKVLAQRIIKNAFNFLASFSGDGGGGSGEDMVPLKSFENWWKKFGRRVDADPGFLEREEGD